MKKNKPSEVFRLEDELTNVQKFTKTIRKYSIGSAVLKDKLSKNISDLYGLKKSILSPETPCLSLCLKQTYS